MTKRLFVSYVAIAIIACFALTICSAQDAAKGVPIMSKQFETPTMSENPRSSWLTFHLAHPGPGKAWPADPNCAIYHKGVYHLHYIHNPHSRGCSFAHLTSKDLVHWKWKPTVLTPPNTGHEMFSGTAFHTKDGRVAITYHGQGSKKNMLAFAADDMLNTWTKPQPIVVKTKDGKEAQMRYWDPDCWLVGDTYYSLSGGKNPQIATSKDLKNWVYQGDLFHKDFPKDLGVPKDEDVSCANMFKIGGKWMLLCISHRVGTRYYLGDFKDGKYLPEFHAYQNWAKWDYFAPESLLTKDGRRVIWGWCDPGNCGEQLVKARKGFKHLRERGIIQFGIQSLPREVSLSKDGTLIIKPLTELAMLRKNKRGQKNITVAADAPKVLDGISADTLELEVTFKAPESKEFGVRLFCDEKGNGGFPIVFGKDRDTLQVDYINPPLKLKDGEDLTLRIFIDSHLVEVFANDRQAAVAWQEYGGKNISLFSNGKPVKIKSLQAWDMKSIY